LLLPIYIYALCFTLNVKNMEKLSKFGLTLLAGVLLALAPVVNSADAVEKEMTGLI
jgi:hypothetical protein